MARCGRCGMRGPNVTVSNIRECYNGKDKAHGEPVAEVIENPWPPSDAQIKYVLGLQVERVLPDDYHVKTTEDMEVMDKSEVSALIGTLKLFKRKDKNAEQPTWNMPEGRYALRLEEPTNNIREAGQGKNMAWYFYQIDKPIDGKWKGYTFIKRLIGGGDDGGYRKVDVPSSTRNGIMARIERDFKKAMLDFGLQSGSCGHCGRALSNPESLARGIGPICAGKMGW